MRFLLALLVVAPFALAWHEDEPSRCAYDGVVEIVGVRGGPYYVDLGEERFLERTPVYQETNGLLHEKPEGVYRDDAVRGDLQRGDGSPLIPDEEPFCVDHPLAGPDQVMVI